MVASEDAMDRSPFITNAIGTLLCILVLVLVALDIQRIHNEAACATSRVSVPTR